MLAVSTYTKGMIGMALPKRPEIGLHKKTCTLRRCPSVLICHLRTINGCPHCNYLLISLVRLTFCTQIDIMVMMMMMVISQFTRLSSEIIGMSLKGHQESTPVTLDKSLLLLSLMGFLTYKMKGVRLAWWFSKGISQ